MTNAIKYKATQIDDINKVMANLSKDCISRPVMTKYEFDQIIGLRTTQLANGAIAFVDITKYNIEKNMDLRKIAIDELLQNRLPYIIKRPLPNNKHEYVRIRDLNLDAVQYMLR